MEVRHTACPVCASTAIKKANSFNIKDIWRCKSCELAFFGQRASMETLNTYYASYPRDHYESPITTLRYKGLLNDFGKRIAGRTLLDYGCNAGFFLAISRENGWTVSGVEISPEARALCVERGLKVSDLPEFYHDLPKASYDVITAFEVVEHMEFPSTFFQRASELLKPGGILYVTTPNFDSLERRILNDRFDIVNFPEHLCLFNKNSLRTAAESAGLNTDLLLTTGVSLTRIRTSLKVSKEKYVSATSTDEKIRAKTETSSFFRTMKNGINAMLNVTKLGNSLKGYFSKP